MRSSLRSALLAAFLLASPGLAFADLSPETSVQLREVIDAGLGSEDVAVKSWSLRAAALAGDPALLPAIQAELENTNVAIRISAATGLLEAGQARAAAEGLLAKELVDGDANTRTLLLERILPSLGEATSRTVLTQALQQAGQDSVFDAIVRHLAYRGRGELHALLATADGGNSTRREAVVRHLIASGRPEGVNIARAWISGADPAAGATVAMALNTVEARSALESLLTSSDAAIAQRVGLHLARHGNLAALEKARDLALNPQMPEQDRLEALALLRDQGAALVSLSQLDGILAEPGISAALRTRTFEVIGATRSPEALDRLRVLFSGLFAEERLDALAGIGFSGQGVFVDEVAGLMRGNSQQALRVAAARALGNLGGDAAAQPLAAQLNFEPDPVVKAAILDALSRTGSSLAAQPIANEFVREDRETTLAGLDALRRIGGTGVAAQVEAISNSFRDPAVRWYAVLTLVHLDPALGRIRLLQALDRPPAGFRDDLNEFSAELQNEVDETLLRHTDASIREAALLRVLNRADGGYEVLRPMLDGPISPDVRRQAVAIVTARRSTDDIEVMRRLTGDVDRGTRLQAYGALAQMRAPENEELLLELAQSPDLAARMIGAYGVLRLHAPEAPAAPPSGSGSRRRR